MLKDRKIGLLLLLLLQAISSQTAHAEFDLQLPSPDSLPSELGSADANAAANGFKKNPIIEHSIEAQVTQSGQDYFRKNIDRVFFSFGVRLGRRQFNNFVYQAQTPLSLNSLSSGYAPFKGLMQNWFPNFQLNDPRFSVQFKNLKYNAKFDSIGVHFDPTAAKSFGLQTGVIAYFEAVIPSVQVQADKVTMTDLENPKMGEASFDNIVITSTANSTPLKIQIPIHVDLDQNGMLQVTALQFTSTLPQFALNLAYSALNLPEMSGTIRIGQEEIDFSPSAFEADLKKRLPGLLQSLVKFLNDKAAEVAPGMVTDLIHQHLVDGALDVNMIDPLGAPNPDAIPPEDRLQVGLAPKRVSMDNSGIFKVGIDAFVEDPKAAKQPPVTDDQKNSSTPAIQGLNSGRADLALAINESFINRMLYMSWQRGYFAKIATSDPKQPLTLDASPVFMLNKENQDEMRIHLKASVDPGGVKKLLYTDHRIHFEFDLIGKVIRAADGTVSVLRDRIENVNVSTANTLVGFLTDSKTVSGVKASLSDASASFQKTPTALIDKNTFPPSVIGIPITISEIETDPNGYLVLYIKFEAEGGAVK